MNKPNTPDLGRVLIEEPREEALCDVQSFGLMLSSMRTIYPRVHYTFPAFATFCRGEEIRGSELKVLVLEIDQIIHKLAESNLHHLVRIRSDVGLEGLDVYQWAHYRGRSFDRERTELVPEKDWTRFLASLSVDESAQTMAAVYGPILSRIARLASDADQADGILKQRFDLHHLPPTLPGFPGVSPQNQARTKKNSEQD